MTPITGTPKQDSSHAKRPASSSQDLLYVGGSDGRVYVFSYPNVQLLSQLHIKNATGLCSDAQGNVFITVAPSRIGKGFTGIYEYAHGGTVPINKLVDHYKPYSCAVDSKNENLAVTDDGPGEEKPNVAVYRHATGLPQIWSNPNFFFYAFCGYDKHHNLFVDGATEGNVFEFAELPKGGSALTSVSLNQNIEFPGSVQWDGSYVTVADTMAHAIYRFTISGYAGTLQGTTTLTGWETRQPAQTWIEGSTVAATYGAAGARAVGVWNYPYGGSPDQTISGFLKNRWVLNMTVSVANP